MIHFLGWQVPITGRKVHFTGGCVLFLERTGHFANRQIHFTGRKVPIRALQAYVPEHGLQAA